MTTEPKIEVGRRVRRHLPYHDAPAGLIVAVHGEVKGRKSSPGPMQIIRADDATFDIITFDGRMFTGCREHDVGKMGIGCVDLLDRVHGPAMIERAHRLVAERQAAEALARAKDADDFHRQEKAREIADPPLFYWNGIKDHKGAKLQRVYYGEMGPHGSVSGKYPAGTLTISMRDYGRFSAKVRACFEVQNDSDIQTDYFDNDRIRVIPTHPLYGQVRAAMDANNAHFARRQAKRG